MTNFFFFLEVVFCVDLLAILSHMLKPVCSQYLFSVDIFIFHRSFFFFCHLQSLSFLLPFTGRTTAVIQDQPEIVVRYLNTRGPQYTRTPEGSSGAFGVLYKL